MGDPYIHWSRKKKIAGEWCYEAEIKTLGGTQRIFLPASSISNITVRNRPKMPKRRMRR